MKKKIFLLLLLLVLPLTLTSCDKDDLEEIIKVIDDAKTPTAVSVSGDYKVLVNGKIKLQAVVVPSTADQVVKWRSEDESIATVSESGEVTGISIGKVVISATAIAGGKETKIVGNRMIEVYENPSDISFDLKEDVYVDDEISLIAKISPEGANNNVTWSSSDENVIVIDQNGVIKALKSGKATITVASISDESIKYSKEITVKERSNNPTAINIVSANTVEVGDTLNLRIEVLPKGTINTVTWVSENENIVTVNADGLVTAISVGTAKVIATSTTNQSLKAELEITVVKQRFPSDDVSLQDKVIQVIENSLPSVIGVSNYQVNKETGKLARTSLGSGAIYKSYFKMKDGSIIYDEKKVSDFNNVETYCYYVITNRHVVIDSDEVKVYLPETEEEIDAKLIQYDDKVDVAVVYFECSKYIPTLSFADSSELKAGEFAIALGNPEGYEYSWSATFGMISYTKRFISDDTDNDGINDWDAEYIQHDVAINPGNSGGPLVNMKGEIIGINTLKLSATSIEGMGFSVPSNVIVSLLPYLEKGERPVRAKIGVTVIAVKDVIASGSDEYEIPEEITTGIFVSDVTPGGVGEKGGILPNDIILTFNGTDVTNSLILRAELGQIIVGSNQEIIVEVYRNGEIVTLKLIF